MAEYRRAGVAARYFRSPPGVIGLVLVSAVLALGLLAPVLAPGPPFEFGFPYSGPPSRAHPFGTDPVARDLLYLVTRGIRTSLTVVGVVMAASLVIGGTLGLAAGYFGGLVDSAVMRVADLLQAVPRFFLALAVVAIYGEGIDKLSLILSLTSWTFLARTLRAETLSVRELPFVEAARSAGARSGAVIWRHVVPHVLPGAVVVAMLLGSRVILIEAGLAFLGLGDRSEPSLGVLASEAQGYLRVGWWLWAIPGGAIVLIVLGLNLMSDGLGRAIGVNRPRGTPPVVVASVKPGSPG